MYALYKKKRENKIAAFHRLYVNANGPLYVLAKAHTHIHKHFHTWRNVYVCHSFWFSFPSERIVENSFVLRTIISSKSSRSFFSQFV